MTHESLEILSEIERQEAKLLTWGVVDGAMGGDELLDTIEDAARRLDIDVDAEAAFEELLGRRLIIEAHDSGDDRYRTRMAEAVRIYSRLRQWFPGKPWATAAPLVADFRFDLQPRRVPRRILEPETVGERLAPDAASRHRKSVDRLVSGTNGFQERKLAAFQLEAAERILRGLTTGRRGGTIITAGTGGGKTLAFYLPAFAWLSGAVTDRAVARILAVYPRNELLKDQLTQALGEIDRLKDAPARLLRIGALFGPTPHDARNVERAGRGRSPWPEHAAGGRVCPYVVCPRCGDVLIWPEVDRAAGREALSCVRTGCGFSVPAGQFALTRSGMRQSPPDVLFTSTEMLNRLSSNTAMRHVVGIGAVERPSLVLLDEVHTYGGTSGAQVALLLRRWHAAAGGRVQFVGLSATLRDAARFFAQLTGLRDDQVREVMPAPGELQPQGMEYTLALRGAPMSATALLSTTIQTLMAAGRLVDPDGPLDATRSGGIAGTRVFAFTDKLDIANRLYHQFSDAEGWGPYARPRTDVAPLAALRAPAHFDATNRLDARRAAQVWDTPQEIGHDLANGRLRVGITTSQQAGVGSNDVVVATAALEVGYNDERVGVVLQHKAPRDPAAFIQRRGRAGRRIEQRPWTIVVLSDFGRDGLAYRSYDRLFDPELPARSLPIANQSVVRMQAGFSTLDWLANRLGQQRASVWDELTRPGGRNQAALADLIEQTLTDPDRQRQLSAHLARALQLDEMDAAVLLWEGPRGILTELMPTALRRLRSGWYHALQGEHGDLQARTSPLPDFLPPNLFTDLQLPEVGVEVPPQNRAATDATHDLAVYTAMTEFAPGNVSFRYAIEGPWAASWVAPDVNDSSRLELDEVVAVFDDLRRVTIDGEDHRFMRPWRIRTVRRPSGILDTSTGRLTWAGGPEANGSGALVDVPDDSPWASLLVRIEAHLHGNYQQVRVRRYATGFRAEIASRGGDREAVSGGFSHQGEPAVIGFEYDGDALCFHVDVPAAGLLPGTSDRARLRSFRAAWFTELLGRDPALGGVANLFQREQLERAFLAAVLEEACVGGGDLALARARIGDDVGSRMQEATDALYGATEVSPGAQRGLVWLKDAAASPTVVTALDRAAETALWGDLGDDAERWARDRLTSTLAAAVTDAAQAVCAEFDIETELVVDVLAREGRRREIWLTEASPGGGGAIETLQRRILERPRRFLTLLDRAVRPTDFEVVDSALTRVLDAGTDGATSIANAFAAYRASSTNAERVVELANVRRALEGAGVGARHSIVAAIAARILRPGTSPQTDEALRRVLDRWTALEQDFGVELEPAVVAYAIRHESLLDPLAVDSPDLPIETRRMAAVVGLLWLRGWRARAQALQASSPYTELPATDRLALEGLRATVAPEIDVAADDWPERAHRELAERGLARLGATDAARLSEAIRRLAAEPTDTGSLLLHASITGVEATPGGWQATVVLGEGAVA